MTNKQLKSWYRRYNRKWFQGNLPDISVRFANTSRAILGDTVFFGKDVAYVLISNQIKSWDRVVKQVLLHECVHVSLPVNIMHGVKFEAKMRWLAARGAFQNLW